MISSKTLKDIVSEARPIIERQLDDAERIAGFRDVVSAQGGDWGALKALIKAQIQDERDESGGNKRVQKILDKADFASAYADMLGFANMNENNFIPRSDAPPASAAAVISSSHDAANGGAVVPGGSSTLYTRPALSAVPGGEPSVPSSDDGGAKMEGGLHPHPGRTDDMSGHKDAQSEQATVSSINQHGRSAA